MEYFRSCIITNELRMLLMQDLRSSLAVCSSRAAVLRSACRCGVQRFASSRSRGQQEATSDSAGATGCKQRLLELTHTRALADLADGLRLQHTRSRRL